MNQFIKLENLKSIFLGKMWFMLPKAFCKSLRIIPLNHSRGDQEKLVKFPWGLVFFGLEISQGCNTILHNFVGWNFRYFFKNFLWQSNKPKISGVFFQKKICPQPPLHCHDGDASLPCGCWKLEIIIASYSLSYEQRV